MTITWNTILLLAEILGAIGIIVTFIKNTKTNSKEKMAEYIKKAMEPDLKDIKNSIKGLKVDISDIKESSDHKEMQRLRYECLCFASDLRKGDAKTRQEYEEIFRMEDTYNASIDKYNIENGFMHEEMLYVHNQYRSLLNKKH